MRMYSKTALFSASMHVVYIYRQGLLAVGCKNPLTVNIYFTVNFERPKTLKWFFAVNDTFLFYSIP